MSEVKTITDLWPLFLTMLGYVIWLVRLEGRVDNVIEGRNETQDQVEQLRVKHEALDSKTLDQLGQIKATLARIEGKLSMRTEFNRGD